MSGFEPDRETQQLCETAIVVVDLRGVAIVPNPFRMLREKRIMHLALQLDISGSMNRESGKGGRVHEFLSLGCSPFIVNSTRTSAQKIDIIIMARPPWRRSENSAADIT